MKRIELFDLVGDRKYGDGDGVSKRDDWPEGIWDDEPDKIQWQDKDTGLPCLIVRNWSGNLCGYVGVTKTHPHFELGYSSPFRDAPTDEDGRSEDYTQTPEGRYEVHGGLTFASFCDPRGKEDPLGHFICHVVEDGEDDNVWWFGFDCGHAGDYSPGMDATTSQHRRNTPPGVPDYRYGEEYRDVGYVTIQCADLAGQLAREAAL